MTYDSLKILIQDAYQSMNLCGVRELAPAFSAPVLTRQGIRDSRSLSSGCCSSIAAYPFFTEAAIKIDGYGQLQLLGGIAADGQHSFGKCVSRYEAR